MPFTIPPGNKTAGQSGFVSDINSAYGAVATVAGVNVLNSAYSGGADPTGVADSTAAIQAAITAAGAGVVFVPAGTYKISSALSVSSGVTVAGAGVAATVITQTSTTAHGITGTDVGSVAIRDLQLTGPGSGSGNGINLVRSVAPNTPYIDISRVKVASFGGHGVFADTAIVSRLARVVAQACTLNGIFLSGGTSVAIGACYGNGNSARGFQLVGLAYSSVSGCAADTNASGYLISGCNNVALSGCGAEASSGNGFVFTGGTANSATSCSVSGNSTVAFSVQAAEAGLTLTSCQEISTSGTPTAFIQTVAGTAVVVINDRHVTANSYAAGTAYEILPTGGTVH